MSRSVIVVLLLIICCITAGLITGVSFFYRLSYVWIGVFIGSWFLSKISLYGISLHRTARTLRSQVGQLFEERFEVYNNSSFPHFWLEIKDNCKLPGSKSSRVLGFIKGKENRSYLVRTRLTQRGVFLLGESILSSGDIFGLFPVKKTCEAENTLLVYPKMVDVHSFYGPAGWLSGGEAIRRRTQQVTTNAAGARDYVPGDPMNRIHWLSTARRNRLMAKEFELDPLAEIVIILDAYRKDQASMPDEIVVIDERDVWKPSIPIALPPSTIEYGVTIAASLARYYLRQGRSVGYLCADQQMWVLPSDRGARQMGKILENLAIVLGVGNVPLEALIEGQVNNWARGSTVIIITPSMSERLIFSAENITQRGLKSIIISLDCNSFGGKSSPQTFIDAVLNLNIPCIRVKKDDNLAEILSDRTRQ